MLVYSTWYDITITNRPILRHLTSSGVFELTLCITLTTSRATDKIRLDQYTIFLPSNRNSTPREQLQICNFRRSHSSASRSYCSRQQLWPQVAGHGVYIDVSYASIIDFASLNHTTESLGGHELVKPSRLMNRRTKACDTSSRKITMVTAVEMIKKSKLLLKHDPLTCNFLLRAQLRSRKGIQYNTAIT